MSKPSSPSSSPSPSSAPCHAFVDAPYNLSYFVACLTSGFSTSTTTNSTNSIAVAAGVKNATDGTTTIVPSNPPNIPCAIELQAYELCVESHNGVAPRQYESEWCEEEKQQYLHCRQQQKKNPQENKNHPPNTLQ